jgi:hypothetical protein
MVRQAEQRGGVGMMVGSEWALGKTRTIFQILVLATGMQVGCSDLSVADEVTEFFANALINKGDQIGGFRIELGGPLTWDPEEVKAYRANVKLLVQIMTDYNAEFGFQCQNTLTVSEGPGIEGFFSRYKI